MSIHDVQESVRISDTKSFREEGVNGQDDLALEYN